MIKSLYATSIVSYGPDLPSGTNFPDGALFVKTANPDAGIYVFSLSQGSDPSVGDQPGAQWTPVSSDVSGIFLPLVGGTLVGDLNVGGTGGIGGVSISRNTAPGPNPGSVSFTDGSGGQQASLGWNEANSRFEITGTWRFTATPTVNGNTAWHAGNDGSGSGLDADLLDGQDGLFYRNAGNINAGTLALERGGAASDLSSSAQGAVIYRAATSLAATAAGTLGQVLSSNGSGAPSWINQSALSVGFATNAGTATTATSASTASSVPWSGVTGADKPALNQVGAQIVAASPNGITVGSAPTTGAVRLSSGTASETGSISFIQPSSGSTIATIGFDTGTDVTYRINSPFDVTGRHIFTGASVAVNTNSVIGGPLEVGFRRVPRFTISGAYSITNPSLAGYCIEQTTADNVTVQINVFNSGDILSIFNNTASSITILQGTGLTMYGPGATTGNRVLEARGICTLWFSSPTVCKITGEIY